MPSETRTLYGELQLMERRMARGAPLLKRRQPMNRILGAHEAAIQEAFMQGRLYAARGEKEMPGEMHRKLSAECARVVHATITRMRKEDGE